eukprot:TRINITY_DN338_c0_g1_i29.p1 TRINITY_DN338_c0_g1~~TRINITY_DN338_c0_g1_i29.p1  ORF type:complete len:642 (-),score=130.69 TRINITY_DN338_c0_g1_i29:197-1840(-)
MKEFIAYLPILKTRFPGVSKYHKQESTSFSLPLHSEILHCFLQFIYQDRINFKILSNERKIENLVAVLRFCEDSLSKFQREILNHFLESLTPLNCIDYILATNGSVIASLAYIQSQAKHYFVKNWGKAVLHPQLESLPNTILLELMQMRSKYSSPEQEALQRTRSTQGGKSVLKENQPTDLPENVIVAKSVEPTLMEIIGQFYLEKQYCDVTFVVSSKEFIAHKYILVSLYPSNKFSIIVPNSPEESPNVPRHHVQHHGAHNIQLDEKMVSDSKLFACFLEYLYTGQFNNELEVSLEHAQSMWLIGNNLLDSNRQFEIHLSRWFSKCLDNTNIFKILTEISEKSLSSVLKEAALDYCVSNIPAEKNLELYQDEVDYVVETAENGPSGVSNSTAYAQSAGALNWMAYSARARANALCAAGAFLKLQMALLQEEQDSLDLRAHALASPSPAPPGGDASAPGEEGAGEGEEVRRRWWEERGEVEERMDGLQVMADEYSIACALENAQGYDLHTLAAFYTVKDKKFIFAIGDEADGRSCYFGLGLLLGDNF